MSNSCQTPDSTVSAEITHYAKTLMEGNLVRLRPACEDDYVLLAAWWNVPEELIFLSPILVPSPQENMQETFRRWSKNNEPGALGYAIEDITSGLLIGHITIWGIHPTIRAGTLGILIAPSAVEKGADTESIALMLNIAFNELGLNKVELNVWEYNQRAIHVYRKLGFVLEGTQRAAGFHAGRYWSNCQMGMLRSEYIEQDNAV